MWNSSSATNDTCGAVAASQHVLQQLGSLGLAVAFLVPCHVYRCHAHLLRGLVCCAAIFLIAWGVTVAHTLAFCAWHISFLAANVIQLLYAAFKAYPIRMDKELEAIYVGLFQPLMMSRKQFVQFATLGDFRDLPSASTFASRGEVYDNTLSVLLSGRLSVLQGETCLHAVESGQFIDSVEYEAVTCFNLERYQVTYMAESDCRILTWRRETLSNHLQETCHAQHSFRVLLGNDVYYKILQVHASRLRSATYCSFLRHSKGKYFSYGTAT